MPKLTITQGKDGLFHARVFGPVRDNGKRPSKRISGHSKKEVEQKAKEIQEEFSRQKPQVFKMTLREAVYNYINYMENKREPASASTIRSYTSIAKTKFQNLMDVPLMDITENMLQDCVYDLELEYSGKYIHNIINFIVPAIRHSRKGFRPDLELPDKEKPVTKVPDIEDLRVKMEKITNRRLYIPTLLAAYCGMRRSEICALDFKTDIEYDVPYVVDGTEHRIGIIHITKALVQNAKGKYVLQHKTKSDAGTRNLIVADWINDILKEIRDDPKFEMYNPDRISHVFINWANNNGINCSLHGLRHFFASMGKALNIPDLYMMEAMGHETNYMLNHYQEIIDAKRAEVNNDLLLFIEKNRPSSSIN